jgi:general secretion pathway protein G
VGFGQGGDALMRNASRGFSLLELVVNVVIILILLVIFLNRSQYYQEQAEKAGMESVAVALGSALTLQYSQLMMRGRAEDAVVLKSVNPMSWLVTPPRNYSGEFFDPDVARIEAGNWFFDLRSRELIYVVRNRAHFKPDSAGRFWVHFHIVSRDGLSQGTAPAGLKFESVVPYSWF